MKTLTHLPPPQAPEIENALLRNLISAGNIAFDQMAKVLTVPDLFYNDSNRTIFGLLLEFYRQSKTIDLFTVSDALLEIQPDLSDYLMSLMTSGENTALYSHTNKHYIQILQEKYVLRQIIQSIYQLHNIMADPQTLAEEALEIFNQTQHRLAELTLGKQELPFFTEVFNLSYQKLQERIAAASAQKLSGINTGLIALNKMTAGWQAGDLIILAARPGMGKTALALFLTKHAALAGDAVLFFSLEMAAWRLADRLILGETGINSHSYRHGTIDQTDNEKIYQIADQFSTLPIFIDEQSSPTIDYIIASSRLAVRKYKAKLIVIDYLQLMNMREQRGQTRDQAIGLVTRKLKQLAKELQLPVILLSQLNRSLESRSSRVPTLADLRESGNIEQDADMVLLLFRPAYYNLSDFRDHETNNILWILTEKFRDGDAKDIIIRHNDNLSDFYNYD